MVKRILLIITSVSLCSCNQLDLKGMFMPTGEGVEKRFEQSRQISSDLKAGTVAAHESYTFYVATDPHINQTHENLDIFNDALRNDSEAPFGVLLGDCTDIRDNLHNYLDALAYYPDRHAFDQKIYHVLGNHDLFFKGWADFRDNAGPSVYWFEVIFNGGKDLYITLDTATATLGRKQTEWLRTFLSENRRNYRHCVILTHTNFFYTDRSQDSSGNMTIEESFALMELFGRHDVALVLQGHDHFREDLTYDNVRYVILGAIKDGSETPEYLKAEVSPDGIYLNWQIISE
ncbi:MAG: metallophosphoesterase [Bacteroidales bacterium]|nr:metallophosphoesterase [Bacteroidales bacterium]